MSSVGNKFVYLVLPALLLVAYVTMNRRGASRSLWEQHNPLFCSHAQLEEGALMQHADLVARTAALRRKTQPSLALCNNGSWNEIALQ
jgi:hypothetical protein